MLGQRENEYLSRFVDTQVQKKNETKQKEAKEDNEKKRKAKERQELEKTLRKEAH